MAWGSGSSKREGAATKSDAIENVIGRSCLIRGDLTADGAFRIEFAPSRRDWGWVLAEIAGSFAELLADGEPERVKLCENGECQWAFYDTTKNRRRRWCRPSECGNVFKVREFRARQRADRPA